MIQLDSHSQERIGAKVANFTQEITSALEQTEVGSEAIEAIEDAGKELSAQVGELESQVRDNAEQIEETSDDLDETEQRLDAFSNWLENVVDDVAANSDDIDDVRNDIEASEGNGSTGENTAPETYVTPETPLEQTAALPQEMIDEESPNVRRAVFVAQGVDDYSRKVPAGRAIRSSELRKVLKAGTDSNGHTETVSRVMNVLDDMGKDDVKIVDRRGEKRIVFSQEAADRLSELTEQKRNHRVVIGETA